MIVDAHAHLWQPTVRRDDILVLTKEPALAVDAMPDRLLPLLKRHGIDAAVIIQSAPSIDHSRFCLKVAGLHEELPAVAGWLDLQSASFAREREEAAADVRFSGIRLMLNRMPDPARILEPRSIANLRELTRRGLAIELLALPAHLALASDLVDAVGEGVFIVDHAGQPDFRREGLHDWTQDMARLAARPNVLTKVSGLAEMVGKEWTPERIYPAVAFLFATFAPRRLMFATNWPVCDLAGGMERWMAGLTDIVDRLGLDAGERADFYSGTAMRAYGVHRFERSVATTEALEIERTRQEG